LLLLAGCGGGEPDNRRQVDLPAGNPRDPIPMQNVDQAVQTEAQAAFATLHRQIRLAAAKAGNPAGLYASLNGTLDAERRRLIGMTEGSLAGAYYRASDYTVAINGKSLSITAAKPGTRGHTSIEYRLP